MSTSSSFPEISIKQDLRQHVLDRPDTYLGNFAVDDYTVNVVKDGVISSSVINYNPAFERCVIEIGSNCVDNVWRSKQFGAKCSSIRFEYTPEGMMSFWNDGLTIPIKKSSISGVETMYNPSIVFGVYMSSTNYNDDEKRRSSGRNGYGCKLCLADDTKIPMWSGGFKEIQDILIGEILIGDDGTQRKVLDKTSGEGRLFKVSQDGGISYVVNENHILTLMMPQHKQIEHFENSSSPHKKDSWRIEWFEKFQIQNKLFDSFEKAKEFSNTISNSNKFDIPLKTYLSLDKHSQEKLVGFTVECVQWKEKNVPFDPYVFVLCLCEGGVLKVDEYFPQYLYNSREIRLKVLAGFIDNDGFNQTNKDIIRQVEHLYYSLGTFDESEIPLKTSKKMKVRGVRKIHIEEISSGGYTGIHVDGNHRFALEDFTVTHNCNTLSKEFKVETQDEAQGLFFSQTWRDNMSIVEPPKVIAKKGKGFTKVSWLPDYAKFKMKGFTPDIAELIHKYLYDIAMLTKLPVYCNNVIIPVKSLTDYAKSFFKNPVDEIIHIQTENSEVVIMPSRPQLSIAFTNGIPNPDGGVHVDAWNRAIFTPLVNKLNTSDTVKLSMAEVRSHFAVFISCSLDNPSFTSQEKSKLSAPKPETEFKPQFLTKMMKWKIIEKLKELLESKLFRSQKKKLEGGRKTHPKVKKLEDANFAGTKKGRECILIYCEGDSAKTFAVAGIERGVENKRGRDYFGILPCGGKILNVRNANPEKIGENEGIQALIQALGLEIELDYTIESNFNRLRYGSIMIITDADEDGLHIEGLSHNFFHALFPTLLKRTEPFIISMKTPLVRVKLVSGEEKKFYSQQAFKAFQDANASLFKGKPRHFKGLGTSQDKHVMDSFGKRLIGYTEDKNNEESMVKAFGKAESSARKDWINAYDANRIQVVEDESVVHVKNTSSNFIENELIIFSIANCARSLPHVMDGLKESQRKILYTVLQQKLTYDKEPEKVYRLSGIVGSITEYVHGEQCLWDTITGMAWDFVGSNNIPILYPDGQFGSRLAMGKDAANARYIYTNQQKIVPYIFRSEDLPILNYIQGEDMKIEPTYYIPVVPLILINGIRGGIGTGFSSKIPAYNPMDIIKCVRIWITDNLTSIEKIDGYSFFDIPEIFPWYQGFTGEIEKVDDKYISKGILKRTENGTEILELPIGLSTDKFREKLISLRDDKKIYDFKDYSSKTRVHFIITECDEMKCDLKNLGLTASMSISNMVAFDENSKIRRYASTEEIIYDFCEIRLKWYEKRKQYIIDELERKLFVSNAKLRFVNEIMQDKIQVYKKKRNEIVASLTERGYPLIDGKYEYLLKMPIDSFTDDMIEKLNGLINTYSTELKNTIETTTRMMWLKELSEFETAYLEYQAQWSENEELVNCGREDKNKGKKSKASKKK